MAIKIGRVELRTPQAAPASPQELGVPSVGSVVEKGVRLTGVEIGTDAEARFNDLRREWKRVGHVHVECLKDNVIETGHYAIQPNGSRAERPGGGPNKRPWGVVLVRKKRPMIRFEAEDSVVYHAGSSVINEAAVDVDASESKKVSYTPDTTERTILKLGSSLVLALRMDEAIAETQGQGTVGTASEAIDSAGGAGVATKVAQKFAPGSLVWCQRVMFAVNTEPSAATVDVRVETDSSGSPSGTLAHANLAKTGVAVAVGDNVVDFAKGANLAAGTYWLLVTPTAGSFTSDGTTSGTADQVKVFKDGAWALSANIENMRFGIRGDADGKLSDSSGLGNHATIQNGSLIAQTGKIGNCWKGDGSTAYLELPDNPTLDFPGAHSIELWVKLSALKNWNTLYHHPGNSPYVYVGASGQVRYETRKSGTATQATTANNVITADTWHHILCVYDGAKMYVYVDGVEKASQSQSGTLDTTSGVSSVGSVSGGSGEWTDGVIDEVRIYTRALTAAEVTARYDDTKDGTRPAADHRAPLDAALDLPEMTIRVLAQARATTTTTAKLRAKLLDKDGAEIGSTPAQVTLSTADEWRTWELIASKAIPNANKGANMLLVTVQDPTNVNDVWLDAVDVVPA
jgi:hypothetical protein